MYRQRSVIKAVSFVGKSKGRFPQCSASQFLLQQKLKTPYLYSVTVCGVYRFTECKLTFSKV